MSVVSSFAQGDENGTILHCALSRLGLHNESEGPRICRAA